MDYQDAELRMLLQHRTREWDAKLAAMRAEIDRKDTMIAQAERQVEVDEYARRRKAEERDEIAPELIDYVRGDSIEAIEQSITRAKAKTASILEGVRQATESIAPAGFPQVPQPQAQPQPQQTLTAEQRQAMTPYTLQQLQAMEPGSPEHRAARAAFGIDRSRGHGLYG